MARQKRQEENPDKGRKPEEPHDESVLNPEMKNELDLSRKERRLLEKERIKGMGPKKKLEYFWMYYKWVLVCVIAGIFAIVAGHDWYENAKRETILAIAPVNMGNFDVEAQEQEIKELLGAEGEYEEVTILSNLVSTGDTGEFDYSAQMAYVTQVQAKTLDVLVMPENIYEHYAPDGAFLDLREVLGEEAYDSLGDQVQGDCLIVSDGSLSEKFGLAYETAYVSVVYGSEHTETAAKWLMALATVQPEG